MTFNVYEMFDVFLRKQHRRRMLSEDTREILEHQMDEDKDEEFASLGVLFHLSLLLVAILIGNICVKRFKISLLSQASVALILGLLAGLAIRHFFLFDFDNTDDKYSVSHWIGFQQDFFFLFLLPPIIFESGFTLNKRQFFKNFGPICTFAVYGTLMSTCVIGLIVFLVSKWGITQNIGMLESMLFGALISATDPVTVLAIFKEKKV